MYPRRKDLFTAWSKAMVEGATVDKPHYHGGKRTQSAPKKHMKRRKAQTRRRRKNAKKE